VSIGIATCVQRAGGLPKPKDAGTVLLWPPPPEIRGKKKLKKNVRFRGLAAAYWLEMNERRQDFELLQRFTRQGEQSAFADQVRRHVDLVFGTALRRVEDPGAAQEITQNVFAALARKAWRFASDDFLPAWLHKAALLESKSWLRDELGRRRREQTAAELGTTMNTPEHQPAFQALVPLLDEALLSLREIDRTALLFRFYENQSLRDVGVALGAGEDAATNYNGQTNVPTGLAGVTAISAGFYNTMALRGSG
jgi:RNA polymerase sigma factor (sigma-70 family)